jgi:HK97 family phage major capsid protein
MEFAEQITALNADIQKSFARIEENSASKASLYKLEEQFAALNKIADERRLETKSHRVFGDEKRASVFVDCLRSAVANSPLASASSPVAKTLMEGIQKADLNSYGSGTGVDFVPTSVIPEISYLLTQGSVARQHAKVINGVDRNLTLTKRNGTSTAVFTNASSVNKDDVAVTPSIFGESKVTLSPQQISVLGRVSEKLLYQSAINVAEMVAIDMTEQCGILEDNACLKGDGSAAFGGITGLVNASIPSVSVAVGSLSNFDQLLDLQASVHESVYNSQSAKYYMSGAILQKFRAKKASTSGVYFYDPASNSFTINGYPVVIWHRMDNTVAANKNIAFFGDMSKALTIGVGREMSIKVDMSRYFDSNQAAFRLTYDFGAVTVQPNAIAMLSLTAS